jgi:serine/threonine protein kinase
MRRKISNLILLVFYYFKILKILKKNNVVNIKLFNFKNWHHGYGYFTALLDNKKVFIKFDTKLLLLQNDLLVYDIANDLLKKHLVKIYHSIILDDIQIIIYEFIKGEELSEEIIIKNPDLIDKMIEIILMINNLDIVHRDIKLDNFIIVNHKIKIIDFTFANSLNIALGFKELDLSSITNCATLEFLGNGLNPKPFLWNDLYSLNKILLTLNIKKTEKKSKDYFIKCDKKYYINRNLKKNIKVFLICLIAIEHYDDNFYANIVINFIFSNYVKIYKPISSYFYIYRINDIYYIWL